MAAWPRRLHILGASGSGTSTLGRHWAAHAGCRHLDTDDFYWEPSNPPFQRPRARDERVRLLRLEISTAAAWVLSGSLCGWGDVFVELFDLVVFLETPRDVRLRRLRDRDVRRYGADAIGPDGPLRSMHEAFLDWAGRYDDGGLDMRSRRLHDAWLDQVPGPVLRLSGDLPAPEQIARIECAG